MPAAKARAASGSCASRAFHPGRKTIPSSRMDDRFPFVKMIGADNDFVVIDRKTS